MFNELPNEIINIIINYINKTEDIFHIRLTDKNFYELLKEIPIYKFEQLIYKIIFKNNIIEKYCNDILVKEIKFKPYGGVNIHDYDNYTDIYFFSTPKKKTYQTVKPINHKYIGCNLS